MKLFKTNLFIIMTGLSLIAIALLFFSKFIAIIPPVRVSNNSASEFSATMAYEHVKHLVQKIGPRPAGSKSELVAAQYISDVLIQNGWKVRAQPFSKVVIRKASIFQQEQQIELINSQNIIAELPGVLPDTIVAGAHYDSVNINAPGALDNASGVGVLLELSRVLSKEPHAETYQLIFFGAEENGLIGSQYYTAQADLSAVRWMLNVDMVGIPLEINAAGVRSAPPELIKQVAALARESAVPFHLSRDFIMMARDSTQGGTSDFNSFLDKNIPALGLGISGRPPGYFHRPEDRLECVSLEDMQRIGDYAYRLLTSVKMEKLGPQAWDELYLPFEIGKRVFFLSSNEIRFIILFVFLVTSLLIAKNIKNKDKAKLKWNKAFIILGVILLLSVIVVSLSGIGENFWYWVKQAEILYYAYPLPFFLARIGIGAGIFIVLAGLLYKIPLARDPYPYWLMGVSLLFAVCVIMTLIRIDLAFPFVFWLLCMDLQLFRPNIIPVLIGPYFIYSMHIELLNSQQWISFYETIHKYGILFLGIYSLLLVPFFLAVFHVLVANTQLSKKILNCARNPALIIIGLLILGLGLVPSYTRDYPQAVTVREEWSGKTNGMVHIFSDQRLPLQLVKELNGQKGKSQFVPILNEVSPISTDASVAVKNIDSGRELAISFKINYTNEPNLIRFKLESAHPFEIKTGDFLPMAKIPKKVELKGVQQPSGNYVMVLQRTPPHKKIFNLTVETQGIMTCTVEAMCPDRSPRIQIHNPLLSVDYEIQYKTSFSI